MMDSTDNVIKKPKGFWSGAIQAVKGPGLETVVEEFTTEMTLVAEGLCEDQQRLRNEIEGTSKDIEKLETKQNQQYHDLNVRLDDIERAMDAYRQETDKRIRSMETAKPKGFVKASGLMGQVIMLAGIIGGSWVLVTILNLFK